MYIYEKKSSMCGTLNLLTNSMIANKSNVCVGCGCDKHAATLNICNAREPHTNSIIIHVLMRVPYRSAQMWLTQMGFRMGSYKYMYNETYTVYYTT